MLNAVSGIDKWAGITTEIKSFIFFMIGGYQNEVVCILNFHGLFACKMGMFSGKWDNRHK